MARGERMYLAYHPLLSQAHELEAGLEVEEPELKLTLRYGMQQLQNKHNPNHTQVLKTHNRGTGMVVQ